MDAAPDRLPAQLGEIGRRAQRRIIDLLESERQRLSGVDPVLDEPLRELLRLVEAGGKRLRPAFCHWGHVAGGGDPASQTVLDAGAAVELLHTMALVHDDVMDGSSLRRGQATAHRHLTDRHAASQWAGESRRYGEGGAVLIGDFAFVYSDQLLAGVSAQARAVFDELRLELCVGQYLDLAGTAARTRDHAAAERIAVFKSGKYTVERPLHLGAAIAGRLDVLRAPLSRIGLPLGRAFQLRDDILGVFGDSALTGKPVGDDLREGKPTPMLAVAAERASVADQRLLDRLGRPDLTDDDIERLQHVIEETGARQTAEETIEDLVSESLDALAAAPVTEEARIGLKELAVFVAWRDR
ncbi:MAG: polyprenyl synthetase family protein [Acidimicrobiia bacterium]